RKNASNKLTVPFQYNPKSLKRSLEPQLYSSTGDAAVRYSDAPRQTIGVQVQLESVFPTRIQDTSNGIQPLLAALELLIYPKSTDLTKYFLQLDSGTMQAVPPLAPLILFVWGPRRVLPVELTQVSVTENLFDPQLNPIRADVDLSMTLYSFKESPQDERDYLMAYLQNMESIAGQGRIAAASTKDVIGVQI
ncbi:MAG: hypothetical protein MI919_35690, partial [Holophagales bacterium]|nr:hypothetical protein [Holophagales bacterium]